MAKSPAIGIDLGTTYSCVAVFQHGKVEIIANDQGSRTTPSYVAFTKSERLIGEAAKNQLPHKPSNTVYDAKRLIGRRYADPTVAADMKHWPFKVISDNNKPKIKVEHKGENKTFFPEEISSMVLTKMKETAEAYLDTPIHNAVVTVPAYFNDGQRQATKDAATIAGLNVLRIINEPTAAAIAYGLNKRDNGVHNVLIFDMGGGTLDVTILNIQDGVFKVKSTAGNTHLGGQDFTNLLVNYLVSEFKLREKKQGITTNKHFMCRLRTICEQAKLTLSSSTEARIEYCCTLFEGIKLETTITRACFDNLCSDLFHSTLDSVEQALHDAKMDKNDIQDIVLAGGSTRIPKIQKILQDFFNGKKLSKGINPDEAVAYGAAIQAAMLNGDMCEELQNLVLLDVTPLSLGVETVGGAMNTVIKRNTTIPVKQTKNFTTNSDNDKVILFQVYQGERAMTKDNHLLGKFRLAGISPAPRLVPHIEVTFDIDLDGIINVHAVDQGNRHENKITITNHGGLSKEDIERMVEEAKKYQKEDDAERDRIATRNALENDAYDMKSRIQKEAISQEDKQKITDKCMGVIAWVRANESATKEELEQKRKTLEEFSNKTISGGKVGDGPSGACSGSSGPNIKYS